MHQNFMKLLSSVLISSNLLTDLIPQFSSPRACSWWICTRWSQPRRQSPGCLRAAGQTDVVDNKDIVDIADIMIL